MFGYALSIICACVLFFGIAPARAQTWPSKPVRIVTPGGPGGGFDTSARIIAEKLGPLLGQSVVVENRPGGGTLIGTDAVLKAPADGYSLLIGGLSNIALNVGLYKNLPYDPLKDFVPIGLTVSWSFTLVARKDLPQQNLRELVAYAKAHPGELTYASTGNGTGQHVAMAVTAQLAGVKLQHIPYRTAAAAYQDILGGRIDLMFDNASTAMTLVNDGRVKALAVSSAKRQAIHPDVPTVMETGVAPLDMDTWFGIFVRADTPPPIIATLREAMAKLSNDPAVADIVNRTGGNVYHLTVQETETLVRRDVERWTKLLREAEITAD